MTGDTYARGPSSRAPAGLVAGLVAGAAPARRLHLRRGAVRDRAARARRVRRRPGAPRLPTSTTPPWTPRSARRSRTGSTPGRRPRRRRAALRPRPDLGPRGPLPGRRRDGACCGPRPTPTSSGSTSGTPLDVAAVTLDGGHAAYAHDGKDLVVRGAGLATTPGTRSSSATPAARSRWRRRPRARDFDAPRLDDHRRRRGLDDAGAVRRLLLVRRERPAVRQGALRLHDPRTRADGRGRERRAGRPAHRRRHHGHPLGARRAGVVVPRHGRDRRPRGDRGRVGDAASRSPTGRRATTRRWQRPAAPHARPGWPGWRTGSGPTRSTRSGSWSSTPRSGMETQTMITLGRHRATPPRPRCSCTRWRTSGTATRSRPTDWRDVWMNEGMAMYLQGVWHGRAAARTSIEALMDELGPVRARDARASPGRRPTTTRRPSARATSTTARR